MSVCIFLSFTLYGVTVLIKNCMYLVELVCKTHSFAFFQFFLFLEEKKLACRPFSITSIIDLIDIKFSVLDSGALQYRGFSCVPIED